ncbi:MAG: glycosyltransferase family 4 protein [Bacteroidales bacterium]|nr:glycosyltransferase family 4 protein [Bacteroidales bacterium]
MSVKALIISDYRDYHTSRPEANVFIELAKLGFDIHIMTYGDAKYVEEFQAVGIKVIDFHPQKKMDKSEIQTIRNYLIDNKIDILHLFNSKSIVNGIQAAKGIPVKVILYRGYAGNINWYDPTAYSKFLHPRVDKIICNSIGVEEYLHKQLFFNKKKTVTINKGHDLEWYKNYKPVDLRAEFNIPEKGLVLVTVANNRRMKGVPYLLKAMTLLPQSAEIHLILIGRDMDTKANRKILNKEDMAKKVHFAGFRPDALNLVAGADAFVLSSIFGESITKSVIEAMSLGVAPIITDIPGNVELVEPGKSGIVVKRKNAIELKNAIMELDTHRNLCKIYGKAAQQRIHLELNTKATIQKTKELYLSLVSNHSKQTT